MIKKLVTICLAIFLVAVFVVLGASIFSAPAKKAVAPATQAHTTTGANSTAAATFLLSDVAKHNTVTDCWTIVSNKVYNVTDLIPTHSGGPDKIIASCGKDATAAFDTKNGAGAHSQRAQDILNNYYVGNLSR